MQFVWSVRRPLAAGLIVALVGISACGAQSPEALIESARRDLAKQDYAAAVIHLKTALQERADLPEARFLLGSALLERGDPVSAAIELRKARELQYPDDKVAPLLAEALVRQGQARRAIDELGAVDLKDRQAAADLKATLASAFLALNLRPQAEAAIGEALNAAPEHVPTLLIQARLAAAGQDLSGASALVARALAKAPNDEDALLLHGDLLLMKRDPAGAQEAYRRALATKATSLRAHLGLLNLSLARQDVEASEQTLAALRKHHPGHWTTLFFSARLSLMKGETKQANDAVEQLLTILPDDPRVLQLAGMVSLQSKSLPKAEQFLTKALRLAPDSRATRRLLVQTHLDRGDPVTALDIAQPLLEGTPFAEDLSLLALTYALNGDVSRAEDLYQQANDKNPDNARTQAALAMTQLAQGKAAATGDLEAISARDAGTTADLALVLAHLRRKDHDSALQALAALEAKQPGMAMTVHLRGITLQAKGDIPGARRSFEDALKTDAGFFPALAALAALDLKDDQRARAEKRFQAFLQAKPSHSGALMALARLRSAVPGSEDEVTSLLTRAVRDNPNDSAPRLLLVRHELAHRRVDRALSVAEAAATVMPNRPDVLEMLGQAQLASGDFQQALSSFSRVAALVPKSPAPHFEIAQTYLKLKDTRSALESAQRALRLAPTLQPAQRLVVQLLLANGRPDDAREVARTAQKQKPDSAAGFALEGDVEAARKNHAKAEEAYRKALQKDDAGTSEATKLHNLLLERGDPARAEAMAQSWRQKKPDDVAFAFNLGTAAYAAGRYEAAAGLFEEVLKARPNDPLALNNLAYSLFKLKRPEARAYAERAYKLMPDFPPVLRTYAEVLAAEQEFGRAIELQERVVSLQPGNHFQRLALARLYVASGDHARGRGEIEKLEALGAEFPAHKELAALRKKLP